MPGVPPLWVVATELVMTAQMPERLTYKGDQLSLAEEPLGAFFKLSGSKPPTAKSSSALWRGYIGSWEITNERLYLVGIDGRLKDGSALTLDLLFPGFPDRVFAHWYSGDMRIPRGKLLNYVHAGYASVYEGDLILQIERGVVVSGRVLHNGKAPKGSGPEGYRIDALTTFGGRKARTQK